MEITEIHMPQLGANDEFVKLVQWGIERGQPVSAGLEIAVLETTKATFALEAEKSGYLYPMVENGQEVPVRAVLALLLDEPSENAAATYMARCSEQSQNSGKWQAEPSKTGLQLTVKARELIEQTGLDISLLPTDRLIRERDVLALLEAERSRPLRRDPSRVVAVYGGSEGGITLVEAIRSMGGYEVVAFLDDTPRLIGTTILGLPVWSGAELDDLPKRGIGAIASHIAVQSFRLQIRQRAMAAGLGMLNTIHASAFVAPSVQMGVGNLIKAGAVVDTGVHLGDCCIIDCGVIVPHDCLIHDGCHLAPGVAMGGGCSIGEGTLIGVGASVASRIRIGRNVIVRPGSVVVSDIPDDVLIGGNPAKVTGKRR
jgi:sugar O-acyltransferase (sialic acid O-acetyltransferase NeuD family)